MIKRALKFAVGPSVGVVIANIGFRFIYPDLFNETWPPVLVQAIYSLVVSYIACFLIGILIEWIKIKLKGSEY